MEYVYAAMLIHKAGGKVNEPTLKKVLEAAGVKVDEARVKALVASLEGVNIDEAVEKAAAPVAAPAAAPAVEAGAPAGEKKEEKKAEKKEEKKSEEAAAAGLGSLFG
jgi:large subunit ribosomal protein L12